MENIITDPQELFLKLKDYIWQAYLLQPEDFDIDIKKCQEYINEKQDPIEWIDHIANKYELERYNSPIHKPWKK